MKKLHYPPHLRLSIIMIIKAQSEFDLCVYKYAYVCVCVVDSKLRNNISSFMLVYCVSCHFRQYDRCVIFEYLVNRHLVELVFISFRVACYTNSFSCLHYTNSLHFYTSSKK